MALRKIIVFLVYSNIWISAGAAGFTWLFFQLVNARPDLHLLAFVFLSTLLTYTFQRFLKLHYNEFVSGPRMEWMKERPVLVRILLIIGLLGVSAFVFFLQPLSILLLFLSAIISFLYAYKIKLFTKKTNLRDIPGVKIFLIALVWAISSSLIPAVECGFELQNSLFIFFGFLTYIVGITIPFDIRDIDHDEPTKKTIPQLIGPSNSKILAGILILTSYLLISYPTFVQPALLPGMIITLLLVFGTHKKRDELYFSFVLDGMLVLVPVLYFYLEKIL